MGVPRDFRNLSHAGYTLTLESIGYFVDLFSTKFDLCEFKRLFKDPMKDFLAVSLVFVF
jgi:hypothetical protein